MGESASQVHLFDPRFAPVIFAGPVDVPIFRIERRLLLIQREHLGIPVLAEHNFQMFRHCFSFSVNSKEYNVSHDRRGRKDHAKAQS
jgi:hypothetical protein